MRVDAEQTNWSSCIKIIWSDVPSGRAPDPQRPPPRIRVRPLPEYLLHLDAHRDPPRAPLAALPRQHPDCDAPPPGREEGGIPPLIQIFRFRIQSSGFGV